MSLWFASWTLSCFLFQTEILLLSPYRADMASSSGFEGKWLAAGGRQPAAWPQLAMATPGPDLGRLQPAAAGARALLACNGGHLLESTGRVSRWARGRRRWVHGLQRRARGKRLASTLWAGRQRHAAAALSNGGARSGAWRPRRHFIEHVARVGVGKVGGDFGLLPGRFGPWAKKEVCSRRPALQLWLRVLSH